MRVGLLALVIVFTGCVSTPVAITRTVMAPLPVQPMAQVAPSDWMTFWASSQVAPGAARDPSGQSAVRYPMAMPELGTLFLVARKHLLLGASAHTAHTDWSQPSNGTQPRIRGGLLIGARMRIGVRFEFGDPRLLLLGSLEPGFDLVPWSTSLSSLASTVLMPAISGTFTPAFETGRLRVFAGLSATTAPAATASLVVDTATCTACGEPGGSYDGVVSFIAGLKVSLHESFALSASLTAPFSRGTPQVLPMFSVAVMYQAARAEPVPHPEPEDPVYEEAPPLLEATPPEEALPL